MTLDLETTTGPANTAMEPTTGALSFPAVRIDKGHFGDVALAGLGAALLYAWPIYEGNGECQAIIDEGWTASNETLLLLSCMVARLTRGRPTGASIG